eukprot:scpid90618/ scgid14699/ 
MALWAGFQLGMPHAYHCTSLLSTPVHCGTAQGSAAQTMVQSALNTSRMVHTTPFTMGTVHCIDSRQSSCASSFTAFASIQHTDPSPARQQQEPEYYLGHPSKHQQTMEQCQ